MSRYVQTLITNYFLTGDYEHIIHLQNVVVKSTLNRFSHCKFTVAVTSRYIPIPGLLGREFSQRVI